MANNSLTFGRSFSPAQFKAHVGITELKVLRNKDKGTTFFISPDDSSVSGPVSKGDWQSDPVFTQVTDKSSGETFWMLHKRSSGAAEHIEELAGF